MNSKHTEAEMAIHRCTRLSPDEKKLSPQERQSLIEDRFDSAIVEMQERYERHTALGNTWQAALTFQNIGKLRAARHLFKAVS